MKKPLIIVNLKTNVEGTGKRALKLAKICEKVSKEKKAEIFIATQATDIYRITKEVSIPILAQHVDSVEFGSHTGKILPEGAKESGAYGTLLNHSENMMDLDILGKTIKRCKETGLKTIVCTDDLVETKKIAKMGPGYIVFEDPNLIGTFKSVSKAKPDNVKRFVEIVKTNPKVIPLCGAGVANGDDVRAAIELGTYGVLVATAVVKSKNPEAVLLDFLKDF